VNVIKLLFNNPPHKILNVSFPMNIIRKLKVLVLDEHIDAVLRTLADVSAVQLIDMNKKLDSWEGTLILYDVQSEAIDRCSKLHSRISTIFSKIDKLSEQIGMETSRTPPPEIQVSKEKSEEVLSKIEDRLSELEMRLSEEERWVQISSNLKEYQTLTDNFNTLTIGQEKIQLEKELLELENHINDSQKALRRGISIIKVTADLQKQTIEIEKLISEIKSMLGKIRKELLEVGEAIQRENLVVNAKAQFLKTAKTVYFEAYVPSSHIEKVMERIKEVTDSNCLITDEHPSPEENVPKIQKSSPSYLTALEKLTYASGYPSSLEVNPTPIMAITFPILFGIMFADVGQGAIFIILGVILSLFKRKVKLDEIGQILRYGLVSSELFILLGISGIFFGFLFGEFFGPSGVLHPISLGKFGPFYFGGFEPTQEPMKMLRFALFVGVIYLSLGLILRIINEVKKRHYKLVPVGVCWLWLLLGGLFMWAYWGGISNISRWFAEGIPMLGGFVMLPLILVIIFTGIAEGFMEGIGFGVEVFAETLSHTLSYCRLMALGLVHSVLNNLFLVLGGVQHGQFPLNSIPLIVIGTILVMTIEGLIVFVHTLRLHWIEWFSKFYSGEGIPFKPFTYKNMTSKGD
jgi:V/A-type H+-transporting ATPase subunit I